MVGAGATTAVQIGSACMVSGAGGAPGTGGGTRGRWNPATGGTGGGP